MQVPSRGPQARFVEFFRAHIDELVAVAEHFCEDFTQAQRWATASMSGLWVRFASLDPSDRALAVLDDTYRRIWAAQHPPTLSDLPYPPLEGEWSPLRPSDAWVATVLLRAAALADPGVDWPLLHLMVRAHLTAEDWSHLTQKPLSEATRYIAAHQHAAYRATLAAALELAGPECASRPSFAAGATVTHVTAHWSTCVVCSGFCDLLVPVNRLIAAASHTRMSPADRQRILNAVFASHIP